MKALLVIDMQEEYVGAGNRYGYDSAVFIDKVNKRILKAQAENETIVYIQNKKILKNRSYVPKLAEGIKVISSHLFCKEKSSVFSNSEINDLLSDKKITEIETIGVDGNCCVASTALDGAKSGLKVIFPCEYIGVKNNAKFTKTKAQLKDAGVVILED